MITFKVNLINLQDLVLYLWLLDDSRQVETSINLHNVLRSISYLKGEQFILLGVHFRETTCGISLHFSGIIVICCMERFLAHALYF